MCSPPIFSLYKDRAAWDEIVQVGFFFFFSCFQLFMDKPNWHALKEHKTNRFHTDLLCRHNWSKHLQHICGTEDGLNSMCMCRLFLKAIVDCIKP